MHLLNAPPADAGGDLVPRSALERAEREGFRRGLWEAGEPWALLFGLFAGSLVGWLARILWVQHGGQ